jgi:hypothetical protein
MVTRTANTAAVPAMLKHEERQRDSYDDRLMRFRTSTAVFRTMIKSGVLSEEDYTKSCDILAEKYAISLCSIFR